MSLGVFGRLWSDSLSRQTRRYSQGKRKEQVSRALAQPYVMDRGLDEGESPERRSASKVEVSRPSKEPRRRRASAPEATQSWCLSDASTLAPPASLLTIRSVSPGSRALEVDDLATCRTTLAPTKSYTSEAAYGHVAQSS